MFSVAIIGRPNVGKSTLFNRLAGRRMALVHDLPGVTRDRRSAPGSLYGLNFEIVDTAGLEDTFDNSVEGRMRQQTERVLDEADVVLFLIDARAGVTPLDKHFGQWLRRTGRPTVLVANKCEGASGQPGLMEAYELGIGEPVPISAEHGIGLGDLHEAILPFYRKYQKEKGEQADAALEQDDDIELNEADAEAIASGAAEDIDLPQQQGPLRLAIVGRPNAGKSTLMNAILGEERVITGPEAGLTRDAISADFIYKNRPLRLIDTAGMRRRARVDNPLERLAVADGMNAIRFAHVVVLMLDANQVLDKQDLTIARRMIEEGRAVVIGVNKWDAADDRKETLQRLKDKLQTSFNQARGVPWVTLSALKGKNVDRLLDAVLETYDLWNKRVSTSALNRWLLATVERHPPPLVNGRRIKLRYMTQVKARPPTFAIWSNKPDELPEAYNRYLVAGIRENFGLEGVPIRILLRKPRNPFATDD
jgi:GTP-binding protein